MEKATKTKIVLSLFLLPIFVLNYFFITDYLYNNLDYCVTHICGCTSNFGLHNLVWMLYPVLSNMGILWFLAYVWGIF